MKHKATFPPKPERPWDEEQKDTPSRVWALMAEPERDDKYPSAYSGGYRHLRFRLVSVVDTYDDNKKHIRNSSDEATSDLELYSQGDQFKPDELYGYGLKYKEVHHMDLYKLSRMHSFLSTAERKLEALKREHGTASDFAHYAIRVAQVLKVHYLIERTERDSCGSYDGGKYRFTNLYERGRFDGERMLWRVQSLVQGLWSDADRAKAAEYAEREAAKERARRETDTEVSA